MLGWNLKLLDLDVAPACFEGAGAGFDAVNLKADTAGRGFAVDVIGQFHFGHFLAVDLGSDVWALGDDMEFVPGTFFHVLMRLFVLWLL